MTLGSEEITWWILALTALCGFVWALRSGQFQDLDRAARLPLDDPWERQGQSMDPHRDGYRDARLGPPR